MVAEALSNAAKHSGASEAGVAVWRERAPEDSLVVEVTDDGAGGASPVAGGGLSASETGSPLSTAGSWCRSPEGGPTLVRAEIPLGTTHRKP